VKRSRIPTELIAPVRLGVVARNLGQLWLVAAAMNVVPLVYACLAGESSIAVALGGATVLLAGCGLAGLRCEASPRLARNEALAIAAIAFLSVSLLMALPFVAAGLEPLNALFESISALTTTGLSTVSDIETQPFAFHLTRCWMQWYGGLGFVVISLAIAGGSRTASRQLAAEEIENDELAGGTLGYARRMLAVYAGLSVVGWLALLAAGSPASEAVIHVLAGVSTGGFSSHNSSLAGMSNVSAAAVTIGICAAAAFPLSVYFPVVEHPTNGRSSGRWSRQSGSSSQRRRFRPMTFLTELVRRVCFDRQVQWLLLCGLLTSLLLGCLWTFSGNSLPADQAAETHFDVIRSCLLNAFSAQTTAGFSSIDPGALDDSSKLVLTFSMLVGGGTGSTAGGFKIFRLLVLLRLLHTLILRTAIPRQAVYEPSVGNRQLDARDREAALLTILLYGLIVVCSWLPFVVSGYRPVDALFEVTSAVGTVGLSTGIVSEQLPAVLKLLLCADMLLGRLEVLALLVLVSRSTWGRRRSVSERRRSSEHES